MLHRAVMDCTWLYLAELDFAVLYWSSLNGTGLLQLVDCTRLYWTSMCLFPPEYARRYLLGKRRYLLGKQVVLWPNQSHWLAAFFTLHSLLSFLAARGKAFGHFNGLSLANSLICKDIFYVCVYASICASLLQSNSISEIDNVLFWVWGEIYPGYFLL